jgi:hypothetical protein
MPFKARQFYSHRTKTPKTQPKRDWSDYNKKMKMRGDITIWLSPDVIELWHVADRNYDGNGAPLLFRGCSREPSKFPCESYQQQMELFLIVNC